MRIICILLALAISPHLQGQPQSIYYASGALKYNYNVANGLLNGEFASYYSNGLLKSKGNFTNNQKQGVWLAYDSSGMLRSKRLFTNGRHLELLAEWTKTGLILGEGDLKIRNNQLQSISSNDKIISSQRYWKRICRVAENEPLFSPKFQELFATGINAGKIILFSDDRFVNLLTSKETAAIVSRSPDEFLIKEVHNFTSGNQKMNIKIVGLGLVYKECEDDKIAWCYFPDVYSTLNEMGFPGFSIAHKLQSNGFATILDMTTFQSVNSRPKKIGERERMEVLLAEIDYETGSWIYLLHKELSSAKPPNSQ